VDLKCFYAHELPFALVSWTGNTLVNRSLRQYANNLGFNLDDRGLTRGVCDAETSKRRGGHSADATGLDWHRMMSRGAAPSHQQQQQQQQQHGRRDATGAAAAAPPALPPTVAVDRVALPTEYDVFAWLGLRYIPPAQRARFTLAHDAAALSEDDDRHGDEAS